MSEPHKLAQYERPAPPLHGESHKEKHGTTPSF